MVSMRVAQPETDVGGHLVVARASGVQALARVADQRGEALLDVEMHILVVEIPGKGAGRDFVGNLRHAALDGGKILLRNDALPGQHAGMGQRATDILGRHALVEEHRGGIALDKIGDGFGKTAGPGLGGAAIG